MERTYVKGFLIVCLAVAAWAVEPRAVMVLEIKGDATALVDGRTRPIRTLQVLPESTKIKVATGSRLRLTYLQSGLRETVTGPLELTTGGQASAEVSGQGRLAKETTAGSKTLVPKSDNMRRMGGALHANISLSEMMDQVDKVVKPSKDRQRTAIRATTAPRIRAFSPSFRKLAKRQTLSWDAANPQDKVFDVKLERKDGLVEAALQDTYQTSLVLPRLQGGQSYVLTVETPNGSDTREFYLLSDSEEAQVRRDLRTLTKEYEDNRKGLLVAEIAYFEERGLLDDALEVAREAVRRSPDDVGLLTTLGRLQIESGDYESAERTLQRGLDLEAGGR